MEEVKQQDPEYFSRWAETQKPKHLWIGCSDSRVVAEAATGLKVGDIFVHRNVGNVLSHADNNGMSALEYSVKVRRIAAALAAAYPACTGAARLPLAGQLTRWPSLQVLGVKHVLVCGHTNCGAVKAALTLPASSTLLASCWISQIRDIRNQNADELVALSPADQVTRLMELNVMKQVFNVCTSPVVQQMWENGREVHVHGLRYNVHDGSLQRVVGPISGNDELPEPEGAFDGDLKDANFAETIKRLSQALDAASMRRSIDGSGRPSLESNGLPSIAAADDPSLRAMLRVAAQPHGKEWGFDTRMREQLQRQATFERASQEASRDGSA